MAEGNPYHEAYGGDQGFPPVDYVPTGERFPWMNATVFDYERRYDHTPALAWVRNNSHIPVIAVTVYVLFIFVGKQYMDGRERFNLRAPLKYWNLFLAIFSAIGSFRTLPAFAQLLQDEGFNAIVCGKPVEKGWVLTETGLWCVIFIFSKFPELIDTVFIVLRKRPLIFLHYWHHITVLLYCWHAFHHMTGAGFIFLTMNYFVHAIMYTYYWGKAAKYAWANLLPPMAITALQLSQMVVGVAACGIALQAQLNGEECHNNETNLYAGLAMYLSYFVLFGQFFLGRYIFPAKKEPTKKKE